MIKFLDNSQVHFKDQSSFLVAFFLHSTFQLLLIDTLLRVLNLLLTIYILSLIHFSFSVLDLHLS